MSSSSIYEKIEEKARQEAQNITNEGIKKAQMVREAILQETNDYIEKVISDNKTKNADYLKTKITELEQTQKQNVLAVKKELINEAKNEALNYLIKLNDQDYTKLIIKLLRSSDLLGNEIVMVANCEFVKFKKLFSNGVLTNSVYDLNKLNQQLGSNYNLKLCQKSIDVKGGFNVISENYDIDNTYETLLNDIIGNKETEIADLLFGKKEV